jgi:hypothetical protein
LVFRACVQIWLVELAAPDPTSRRRCSPRGSSGRLLVALSLGVAIALVASNAEAQRVVFVSSAGPPLEPGELAPLLEALEEQGILASPAKVRAALGPRFPMAAHDPALSGAAYAKLLDQAHLVWTQQPPLEKMLPVLDATVEAIRRNSALLIRDPSQRSRVHKILVARALAYQRAGDLKRSEDSMAELICMSPNHVVSRSKDGPAAEQLYQLTHANLAKRGRGTLTVKVSQPDVQLYVGERITRPGVPMRDLIPCRHRVVLIDPLDRARQYEPVVARNQNTVLEIDWDVDPAVHVTPGWVELRFQTETERADRAELARRLVHSGNGADAFVLIDVILVDRERHVVASLRSVRGGQILREASCVVTGDDTAAMRALARFIGSGLAGPGIHVRVRADVAVQRDPAEAGTPAAAPPARERRIRKYVATVAAGAAVAGGLVMIHVGDAQICSADERDANGQCPKITRFGAMGAVALGIGAVLGGAAGYFWYADRSPCRCTCPCVGLQLDPGRRGGAIVATWRLP